MCLETILGYLQGPYSAWGLKHRADRLAANSPYKQFLYAVASAVGVNSISKYTAKKAVEYFRTGNPELISVALKLIGFKDKEAMSWLNDPANKEAISL